MKRATQNMSAGIVAYISPVGHGFVTPTTYTNMTTGPDLLLELF